MLIQLREAYRRWHFRRLWQQLQKDLEAVVEAEREAGISFVEARAAMEEAIVREFGSR